MYHSEEYSFIKQNQGLVKQFLFLLLDYDESYKQGFKTCMFLKFSGLVHKVQDGTDYNSCSCKKIMKCCRILMSGTNKVYLILGNFYKHSPEQSYILLTQSKLKGEECDAA